MFWIFFAGFLSTCFSRILRLQTKGCFWAEESCLFGLKRVGCLCLGVCFFSYIHLFAFEIQENRKHTMWCFSKMTEMPQLKTTKRKAPCKPSELSIRFTNFQ